MMEFLKSFRSVLFGHVVAPKGASASLIITAKVVDVMKHPNADRLQLVALDTGTARVAPVVCGASNFSIGDIVALALPGAHIARNIHSAEHEPFDLERATIRGVESEGMLCSGFELGLRETPETREEGILIFPKNTPVGIDAYAV